MSTTKDNPPTTEDYKPKKWVWPVTVENWPTVKEKNIWAVGTLGKGKQVTKGDMIAFYVKTTGLFQGIFRVKTDWHEPSTKWPDVSHVTSVSEIDLEPVQFGFASLKKLTDSLDFIEKKKNWGIYLKGTPRGPANSGKPISEEDYNRILDELKSVQEKPEQVRPEDVDEVEELPDINDCRSTQGRIHKLPPPSLKNIDSIITDIKNGKYAIPTFQRDYTWTYRQIEELWESIFQGFFVGSILTWDYDDQIAADSIQGAPKLQEPSDMVLDGQQRLTSLFYAVTAPENKLASNKSVLFFVNLKAILNQKANTSEIVFAESTARSSKFGYLNEEKQFAKKIFPITKFDKRDYTLWLNSFKDYLIKEEGIGDEDATAYFKQIQEILDFVWFEYTIPLVRLPKSLGLDSVAEIFEKLNSKGTRLGVFDLLNARFIKHGIHLREEWVSAKQRFENIEYMDEKISDPEKYTLQTMCLFKKGYIRRKELLTLDAAYMMYGKFQKDEFMNDWKNTCKHISSTIDQLRSTREWGFGAIKVSMIPYTTTIPILAALGYKIDGRGDRSKCMSKIQRWYWSVATSDSYSGSTDTKIEKDYRELLHWFDDDKEIPSIVLEQRIDIDSLNLANIRQADSVYKAVMCLISRLGASDFVTNEPPEQAVLDDHHIFPKSKVELPSVDSILNKTLLNYKTNRKSLSDKLPREYIKEITETEGTDEANLRTRLGTHLISDTAFDCLKNNDYEGFIREREQTIRNAFKSLIEPMEAAKDGIQDMLHKTESQHLEYKSSMRWDYRQEKHNPQLEEVIAKEICAFMNSEGGYLLIGVDDDGKPIGLDMDYSTFRTPGYDSFAQCLTNLINNNIGKNANKYVNLELIIAEGVEICVCKVSKSPNPVFFGKEKKFFIRANNTCQPLDMEQAHKYITEHWS